ncbi:MAG: TfoX/Sxy family protein [Burkholderiales bacterium]|nr:TfoX/Sxy family protein [Burkholderiales bacterium]
MSKPSRAAADEFRDYCLELLSPVAPRGGVSGIVARRMFGGTGFSMDGKTFAIIAFDQLWLKADDEARGVFEAAGCDIFTYDADGKTRTMGYYTVPPDAMESAALMKPWAELAWGAALRAAAGKASTGARRRAPAVAKSTSGATATSRRPKQTQQKKK